MRNWKDVNGKLIIKVLGLLLIIEGFFMWLCLPFSHYFQSGDFFDILLSGIITTLTGLIIWFFTRKNKNKNLGKREGYIIVTFAWIIISIFGALPFVLNGAIPNYTNAFFETMSGFTTTGASILTDIESVPKGLLFWRSLTHWIGGMGIIVLSLAILPILGIGGMQLFAAEVPGPTPDKLHPRVTGTAKRLWGIYILLTLVETVFLLFGGMDFFDSLCHSFGTMATGGFSTKNNSIMGFSPYIQYVIAIFMILAGTNFTLHYFALMGKFDKLKKNEELRFYLLLIIIALALLPPLSCSIQNFTGAPLILFVVNTAAISASTSEQISAMSKVSFLIPAFIPVALNPFGVVIPLIIISHFFKLNRLNYITILQAIANEKQS